MTSGDLDQEAIQAVLTEHVEAVNTCDVELLLAGFTDDIVYVGPGMSPILGKDSMRDFITPIYAAAKIQIAMSSESIEVDGDRATQWGTCRGTMQMGSDEPVGVNLHYCFVYRREASGDWRISHDFSTPGP